MRGPGLWAGFGPAFIFTDCQIAKRERSLERGLFRLKGLGSSAFSENARDSAVFPRKKLGEGLFPGIELPEIRAFFRIMGFKVLGVYGGCGLKGPSRFSENRLGGAGLFSGSGKRTQKPKPRPQGEGKLFERLLTYDVFEALEIWMAEEGVSELSPYLYGRFEQALCEPLYRFRI